MNHIKILYSFLENLLKSGTFLAILLTLLDLISNSVNLVSFYSFVSGSFIIIAFFQYYIIERENKDATVSFLIHSIIGGIVWVIYSIIMYLAHINNIGLNNVIILTSSLFLIVTTIYYYLCINNKLNF